MATSRRGGGRRRRSCAQRPGAARFALCLGLACAWLGPPNAVGAEPELNGFDPRPASIPVREIVHGGPPRDGIRALERPATEGADSSSWPDGEVVVGVAISGEARAYPLAILVHHELANDVLGGKPILVSYCPLCGTALVFDRRLGDEVQRFGVSGLLYRSDLLMFDRSSESLWSQISAKAVTGARLGQRLTLVRSRMLPWGEWRRLHPETTILSRRTGFDRPYDRAPYGDYATSSRLLFPAPRDWRYHAKTPTLGLRLPEGASRAYPAKEVQAAGGRVEEEFAGQRIVVEYDAETRHFDFAVPPGIDVIEGYWFAWMAFHPESSVFTDD